ncbi:unnamed protein product [Amoebophrya sp. A25]|nr:unnamed protein product [Amoebophrya sp. A25]|eukprot:GSA25T00019834001.1
MNSRNQQQRKNPPRGPPGAQHQEPLNSPDIADPLHEAGGVDEDHKKLQIYLDQMKEMGVKVVDALADKELLAKAKVMGPVVFRYLYSEIEFYSTLQTAKLVALIYEHPPLGVFYVFVLFFLLNCCLLRSADEKVVYVSAPAAGAPPAQAAAPASSSALSAPRQRVRPSKETSSPSSSAPSQPAVAQPQVGDPQAAAAQQAQQQKLLLLQERNQKLESHVKEVEHRYEQRFAELLKQVDHFAKRQRDSEEAMARGHQRDELVYVSLTDMVGDLQLKTQEALALIGDVQARASVGGTSQVSTPVSNSGNTSDGPKFFPSSGAIMNQGRGAAGATGEEPFGGPAKIPSKSSIAPLGGISSTSNGGTSSTSKTPTGASRQQPNDNSSRNGGGTTSTSTSGAGNATRPSSGKNATGAPPPSSGNSSRPSSGNMNAPPPASAQAGGRAPASRSSPGASLAPPPAAPTSKNAPGTTSTTSSSNGGGAAPGGRQEPLPGAAMANTTANPFASTTSSPFATATSQQQPQEQQPGKPLPTNMMTAGAQGRGVNLVKSNAVLANGKGGSRVEM